MKFLHYKEKKFFFVIIVMKLKVYFVYNLKINKDKIFSCLENPDNIRKLLLT